MDSSSLIDERDPPKVRLTTRIWIVVLTWAVALCASWPVPIWPSLALCFPMFYLFCLSRADLPIAMGSFWIITVAEWILHLLVTGLVLASSNRVRFIVLYVAFLILLICDVVGYWFMIASMPRFY